VPNDINLGPLQLKQAQPLGTMFNRLLVCPSWHNLTIPIFPD